MDYFLVNPPNRQQLEDPGSRIDSMSPCPKTVPAPLRELIFIEATNKFKKSGILLTT